MVIEPKTNGVSSDRAGEALPQTNGTRARPENT